MMRSRLPFGADGQVTQSRLCRKQTSSLPKEYCAGSVIGKAMEAEAADPRQAQWAPFRVLRFVMIPLRTSPWSNRGACIANALIILSVKSEYKGYPVADGCECFQSAKMCLLNALW